MNLLKINPEDGQKILKLFKTTEAEVEQSVKIIKDWKQKQPHLPTDISDDFIRRVLARNKFRIERTKEKLENYFTLRGHNPELTIGYENIQPSKLFVIFLLMPQVTPNFERIIISKLVDTKIEIYSFQELLKLCLATFELGLQYDNSIGVKFILDFQGFTLKHFFKWNPVLLHKAFIMVERAYSCRISGVIIVNGPDFLNKVLGMMKMVLPLKVYERIQICSELSDLSQYIPEECLPTEYGGTCCNCSDLLEQWDEVFKTHRDFFIKNSERVSSEHLRLSELKTDELFGPNGSFKKLTFD